MPENLKVNKLPTHTSLEIYTTDSPIDKTDRRPLPAFFYFALTGRESLAQDPYNQPIVFLGDAPIRKISFDLPFHGGELSHAHAIEKWKSELHQGNDFLNLYLAEAQKNIANLIDEGYVDPNKMAIGGLSRGAFIATHLAAREPRIKTLIGFAPMTQASRLDEKHRSENRSYDLEHLIDKLIGRKVRFYIGNRDMKVGTSACYAFIEQLADHSYKKGFRSPPVDLIISPSVGHQGHGTLPFIFQEGASWLKKELHTTSV